MNEKLPTAAHLRLAASPNEAESVQSPAPIDSTGSLPHVTAATAESVIVSLRAARRVGAETALVLAVIQAGLHDYVSIVRATGMTRSNVRIHWARLSRYGYALPDHQTAIGAAASAPVGSDTHN